MPVQIPCSDQILNLHLPESWNITGVLEPATVAVVDDPEAEEETQRALSQPTGCSRLSIIARDKSRVVIVIDDGSRFLPVFRPARQRRARLLMYAPTIPAATQANLPFVTFTPTVEQTIEMARAKVPAEAEVLIFPHGGVTYPEIG